MIMMVQTGTLRLKMFTDSRTMGALKFYCHDLNMIGRVDKFEITERPIIVNPNLCLIWRYPIFKACRER